MEDPPKPRGEEGCAEGGIAEEESVGLERDQSMLSDLAAAAGKLEDLQELISRWEEEREEQLAEEEPGLEPGAFGIELSRSSQSCEDDEIDVIRVIGRRRRKRVVQYRVVVVGSEDPMWVAEDELADYTDLLRHYDQSARSGHAIARQVSMDMCPANRVQRMSRLKKQKEGRRPVPRKEVQEKPEYVAPEMPVPTFMGGGRGGGGGRGMGGRGMGGGPPPAGGPGGPPPMHSTPPGPPPAIGPSEIKPEEYHKVLERVEPLLQAAEKDVFKKGTRPTPPSMKDMDKIAELWSHIIDKFARSKAYQDKYTFIECMDSHLLGLRPKDQVPSYFANVGGETIFNRKVLSMAGLRNLVYYGFEIFGDLKEKLFIGDLSRYASRTGLSTMRHFTGNTVDLDTCVLRPSDGVTLTTINAINAKKGEKTWRSGDEFGDSPQATEIARAASATLLEGFIKDFSLTVPQQRERRVLDDGGSIPLATNNTDRGRHPIWQYRNAGINSFHANVPNIPDVVGALLRSPFHGAKAYLISYGNKEKEEQFFEDAIADSCFNGKWKSIEEFLQRNDKIGTVIQVLEELQANNQAIFTPEFFDNDDDECKKEIAAMVELSRGKEARDKTGKFRKITPEDVVAWVKDPGTPI